LKIQFVKKHFKSPEPKTDDSDKAASSLPMGELSHTGRLGETMTESVAVVKIAVFNYLKQNNLAKDFDKDSYHLHVPQGAIPKDGPSAGVSLFAALMSVAMNKPVVKNIAMTGEITTLGEVISIGGVREKLTACKNHDVKRVILPLSNKKHVHKLPKEFRKGFTIMYVKNVHQVKKICFESADALEKKDYKELRAFDIEVEEYKEDLVEKEFLSQENILERNFIEELM
jgi:ATP-dependent Lon protease